MFWEKGKKFIAGFLSFLLLLSGSPLHLVSAAISDSRSISLTEIEPAFDPRQPGLFVNNEDSQQEQYAPDDIVRVSIVLDDASALEKGFSPKTIGRNKAAIRYRDGLEQKQSAVTDKIEKQVLGGDRLNVTASLTLVANLISADVEYRQIQEIEKVSGVKEVVIENVYKLFETGEADGDSGEKIAATLSEYTGVGSRIAIIDSGVNHEHEAFDADALEYSLRQSAPDTDHDGKISDEELNAYKTELDFLSKEEVEEIISNGKLHVKTEHLQVEKLYHGSKIPFAYNYCDQNLSVQNKEAGFHGSHVAGIAAANAYLKKEGEFVKSTENGGVVGTAPDAQILNLKVMGSGSCTDSVIAAAIEDAVTLGADVMNLSLGLAEVGFSCPGSLYGTILDDLSEKGILVMGAIGNDGSWIAENRIGRPDKLYAEDVNMSTTTPPSSYAELMGVAWANGKGGKVRADMESSSAYGIPSSLMLQPEITAAGTKINSVKGDTNDKYTELSGTSMASPDVAGAAAVVSQYIRAAQEQFGGKSFLTAAQTQNADVNKGKITGSLLMSTADPMRDSENRYYSLLRQGAGLLNTKNAASAKSFIEVSGQNRGRVKAEVGDSPDGKNIFTYSFTLYNVSNRDRAYTFRTDLFTEDTVESDGIKYLADYTRTLSGNTTYKIGGNPIEVASGLSADVDKNNVTDYRDAQALLDYLSGNRNGDGLDLEAADVDHDEKPTTYDAHLILKSLNSSTVMVEAGESITIDVTIEVTEDLKKDYPNGAYIEGFTYVEPVGDDEGNGDVTHSIPILGFCGNWSDPSMFDRNSYVESLAGKDTVPYTQDPSKVYDMNYLNYQDPDGKILRQTANPFLTDANISFDRLAMGTDDTIYDMKLTLIRPAGALAFVVMKTGEAGNRDVLYMDSASAHETCVFPSRNSTSGWNFAPLTLSVHVSLEKILKTADVQSGDKIEIGAVAVPEYYEEIPGKTITKEYLKTLIEGGRLGKGAFMTTTVTLDNEAPIVADKKLTLSDNGSVVAEVTDDQHIAYVGLYSNDGKTRYAYFEPTTENDVEISCTLSSKELQQGGQYALVVGDYAGNFRMYRFTYGEKPDYEDYTLAYVCAGGSRIPDAGAWVLLRPKVLNVQPHSSCYGILPVSYTDPSEKLAGADAADGYLWQVFENGLLYAAPIDDLNNRSLVGDLSAAGMGTVRDLAFSETDKKLYAVDGTNVLWQIDPMTGATRRVQIISADTNSPVALYGLAIGKNGMAYTTCYDEVGAQNRLLKWSTSEIQGQPAAVTASVASENLTDIKGRYVSLTWADSDQTALYAACAANLGVPDKTQNYLYKISVAESIYSVSKSNEGTNDGSSRIYAAVRGLVNLSVGSTQVIPDDGQGKVTGISVCSAPKSMLTGDTVVLSAALTPWTAKADPRQITWKSDQPEVVHIDNTGKITARGVGTAKITASYPTAEGDILSEEVTISVSAAPAIQVSALLREGDGRYYFETFRTDAPADRKIVSGPQRNFIAGTLNHDGNGLYLRTQNYGYRVDPNDFSEVSAGVFNSERVHSDAAPGKQHGLYTNYGYLALTKGLIYLFGGSIYAQQEWQQYTEVGRHMQFGGKDIPYSVAAICYEKSVEDYPGTDPGRMKGADMYYLLSEDGTLYRMTLYNDCNAKADELGKIEGVNLPRVCEMTEDSTASMIYDEETELLVLISKIGTGNAKIQVIDPENCELVMTREFDGDVRQVGILYQYDYSDRPGVSVDEIIKISDCNQTEVVTHASDNITIDGQENMVKVEVPVNSITNGLWELDYDSQVLTLSNVQTELPFSSYHDDKNGKIKFAFADSEIIPSETVRFLFSYEPQKQAQTAKITFTEIEKGDPDEEQKLETWEEILNIPAKPRKLTGIKITEQPKKTTYLEGQEFDPEGLKVSAVYDGEEYEELTPGQYEIEGYESTPGPHKITVRYLDFIDEFTVTVEKKSPKSLAVTTPPKTDYIEGMTFSDEGMVLTLTYDNGETKEVREGWSIQAEDLALDTAGDHIVHISYQGLETTLTVHVKAKSIVDVSINTLPKKLTYFEGEPFEPEGLSLLATYDNGDTEVIEEGWQLSEWEGMPGKHTVTVSYKEYAATFEVAVRAKEIERIEISEQPQKTEYIEGTKFDPTGMKITVRYNNGTSVVVSDGWELEYDFSKPGKSQVVVSYQGYEATLSVTVTAKTLTAIEVTRMPSKTEYVQDDTFDPTGMELTLHYDNGTTETISEGWTLEYDFSKTGSQTVKVLCGGMETSINVTVTEKQVQPSGSDQPTDPQKPTDSQQPVDPSTDKKEEDANGPQTGDDSRIGLWFVLMLLSGGAAAVLSFRKRRERSDKES